MYRKRENKRGRKKEIGRIEEKETWGGKQKNRQFEGKNREAV